MYFFGRFHYQDKVLKLFLDLKRIFFSDHSYATQETTLNRLSAANNDLQQLYNKLRVRNTRLKQKVKSLEDALENVKSQRTKIRVQLSKLILFKNQ